MTYIFKIKKIIGVVILFTLGKVSPLLASEFVDDYLKNISVTSVTAYCTNTNFLSDLSMDKSKCIEVVTGFTAECDDIIKPLVPDMIFDGAEEEIFKRKMRSISELYSMCIKSFAYDYYNHQKDRR